MILLDTNILVYASNIDAPQHPECRRVLDLALAQEIPAVLVPQVLLELYAVVTNPRRVAHPLPPSAAWEQVRALRLALPVLDAGEKALDRLPWEDIDGPLIFDAYLVAQMRVLGISVLCTYNLDDFQSFTGILAKTPGQLLG